MAIRFADIRLYRRAAHAMKQPFRYERNERFVLNEVVRGFEQRRPVDDIFIDAANDALARQAGRSSPAAIDRVA